MKFLSLKSLFVCLTVTTVVSCGTLIKPNVKTAPATLHSGMYQLDKNHATLLFKINHLGYSKYVGRFNDIDATLDFDPHNPSNAKVSFFVNINSIDANNSEFEKELLGAKWFDSNSYPTAVFQSTLVEVQSENQATVKGDLNMHGITSPVTLNVMFNGGARNIVTGHYTLGFSTYGTIKRSDFGIKRLIPAIGDEVEIEMHAEFILNE